MRVEERRGREREWKAPNWMAKKVGLAVWQYARVSDLHRRIQQLLASMLSFLVPQLKAPKTDKER